MKKIVVLAVLIPLISLTGLTGQKRTLDDNFVQVAQGVISIPPNFTIAEFYQKNKKSFYFFDQKIVKGIFKPTQFFTREEEVLIYRLLQPMQSEECLAFIRKKKGIPANAQRLLIAWSQLKLDTLLTEEGIFGLDYKENLWLSPYGCYQVVTISKGLFNRLLCNLACYEDGLPAGSYIIFTKRKK